MRTPWSACRPLLPTLALTLVAGPSSPAQTPVFGTAVELVRVDVVVLDKDGRPVTGLTKDDFTVEEEGRPQAITSFEPVVVRSARPLLADEPPRLGAARLRAPSEGRCVLILVDDIHLSPPVAERVRQSLRKFLEDDVREGDWVTVVAPWQQLWWTARNGWEYRQLASVVSRISGQGSADSYHDFMVVRTVEYGEMGMAGGQSAAVSADQHAGTGGPGQFAVVGDPNAPVKQEESIARVKQRTAVTLGGLEQALESLVKLRGHKSLVMISEGFLLLPKMPGYQEAIDVARRANVAIHFVDPRGLVADENGFARAMTLTDSEGIAEVTGGTVFSGNDTEAGLRRVAAESDAYYLLGYEPAQPGRGERKLKVRVLREGLTVRARTRYYVAAAPAPSPGKPGKSQGKGKEAPEALSAMRSLADTTDLPLRVETLFFEPNHKGEVATMLATEVVPPPGPAGSRLFKLVSEARALDGTAPVHDQFEGSPKVTPGVPVILARQWNLTPGVWQLRLLVEDTVAKRIGTLVHTFEVPDAKRFRISTPILTAEIEDPNGKRQPKVALSRTFRTGSTLYCQYSAYGAPAAGKHDWVPHVFGSWTLRRGEAVVRQGAETLIQPANDGRVTRTLGIGLQGLATGDYRLVLNVRDGTTGQTLSRAEPFTVAP